MVKRVMVWAACLAAMAGAASGATYHVSPAGDDANPGTPQQPLRTVGHAAELAVAGDTVVIGEGVYSEVVSVPNSGEEGRPITFRGEPARAAVLDAADAGRHYGIFEVRGRSHVVVEGLAVRNGLAGSCGYVAFESDHVTFRNCLTSDTAASGFMVWQSKDVVIDGCEVTGACSRGGEETISVKFDSDRVQVSNNHIHHTGHEGIDVKEGSKNVRVFGNHVHDVQRQGLYVDSWNRETYNIEFFNNVVHDCRFGIGACAETGGPLHDVKFYNNLVYNCPGPGLFVADWGGRRSRVAHPIDKVSFVNNTVHACGAGWGCGLLVENAEATGILFRNNIISRSGPPAAAVRRVGSIILEHNLVHEADAFGEDCIVGDPLFVDPDDGDFHLREGSPAVDAGSAKGVPALDMDGQKRPAGKGIDIGADELSTEEGAEKPTGATIELPLPEGAAKD